MNEQDYDMWRNSPPQTSGYYKKISYPHNFKLYENFKVQCVCCRHYKATVPFGLSSALDQKYQFDSYLELLQSTSEKDSLLAFFTAGIVNPKTPSHPP